MSEDVLPPVEDGLAEKIKNFIKENYEPVASAAEANVRVTTNELLQSIERIYPDSPFTGQELAQWLHELGFQFWDAGNLNWEWLLKTTE